jgi:hypothetical protein
MLFRPNDLFPTKDIKVFGFVIFLQWAYLKRIVRFMLDIYVYGVFISQLSDYCLTSN